MKSINLRIIQIRVYLILLIAVFLFSCNIKQNQQEQQLIDQAISIIINKEGFNPNEIENTISSIKSFLSEYPNSKHYSELSGYIDDLYRCLDFHKVREYNNKFEELSNKEYSNVNLAIQEQESFLDEFTSEYGTELLIRKPKLNSLLDEVKAIEKEFESMKVFFDRDFSDLVSYNSEVKSNAYTFENSSYETVRKSWGIIADNQRDKQAEKDMNKKVANFEEYLKNDAKRICNYNFNDFIVDDDEIIQTISIGSPSQHDSYNAKVCEGTFRVYLKGAYIGWDKGTAKISVKGMIAVKVDENNIKTSVEYESMDFRILETTGDLPRE